MPHLWPTLRLQKRAGGRGRAASRLLVADGEEKCDGNVRPRASAFHTERRKKGRASLARHTAPPPVFHRRPRRPESCPLPRARATEPEKKRAARPPAGWCVKREKPRGALPMAFLLPSHTRAQRSLSHTSHPSRQTQAMDAWYKAVSGCASDLGAKCARTGSHRNRKVRHVVPNLFRLSHSQHANTNTSSRLSRGRTSPCAS